MAVRSTIVPKRRKKPIEINRNQLPVLPARIQRLKDRAVSIVPQVCPERAILVTESYKGTEGQPEVLRRAEAFKHVLESMTIFVPDDQLVVGNLASHNDAGPLFPEYSYDWMEREQDEGENRKDYPFRVDDETRLKLRQVYEYWRGKSLNHRLRALQPAGARNAEDGMVINNLFDSEGMGHLSLGYHTVVNEGLESIIEKAKRKQSDLGGVDQPDATAIDFIRSVIMSCEAVVAWAQRYARLLDDKAQREQDTNRKAELQAVAEVCRRVPAKPARTFWEAIQAFWFIHLAVQLESNGHGISPGRFDQYMFPYYRADIESGQLTKEQAKELLECLWVKLTELIKFREGAKTAERGGFSMFQNLCVGGETPDGKDASNELSYLILDVVESMQLPQPTVSLRWFSGMNDGLLNRSLEVIRTGIGMPALFNDGVVIPQIVERGIDPKDALDYAFQGCVEPNIPGKSDVSSDAGFINLPKCLELAIFNGIDPLTGIQLGPQTGYLTDFKTFDQFEEAFKKQALYFLDLLLAVQRVADEGQVKWLPLPFLSAITEDCIERAKEIHSGGAMYAHNRVFPIGPTNVADSMAALKKLVYEEKLIAQAAMMELLRTNFEGREDLRQLCLKKSPKFGNDIDYVDHFARDVLEWFRSEAAKRLDFRGVPYTLAVIIVAKNVRCGKFVGASPDGRKAYEPLADGGVSPMSGRDTRGPTACMCSVAKIEHRYIEGTLLNMKFSPVVFATSENRDRIAALVKAYFTQGGYHVQFNVVDKATLLKAQKHPEQYKNLVVRVAGFSALFTRLAKDVQDNIIARTEHVMGCDVAH